MEQTIRPRPSSVWTILVGAVLAAASSAVFVLVDELQMAGAAAAVAVLGVVVAGWSARESGEPRVGFAASMLERIVDAAILGAVAWSLLPERAGAAALVALAGSYVAAYLEVKASGLGFEAGAWGLAWPLAMVVLAAGLVAGEAELGLWGAAAISIAAALARSVQVARQREPS
ncbi:MAG TPA: hypothetical protein VF058_01770 [Actinomycetota bacterium]